MTSSMRWATTRFVWSGMAWLLCTVAQAGVVNRNGLTLSSLQIVVGSGTLMIDPWTAQGSATVNNSLGQNDGQFDSTSFNGGSSAAAAAAATWADAQGGADLSGPVATASSSVLLPGQLNQADASAAGDLFTTFMVTGGVGAVDVRFSMDLNASQDGSTDGLGYALRNELIASLRVDALADPVLFFHSIFSVGPGSGFSQLMTPNLSATAGLMYDTPYFVFVQADAETHSMNVAEPGSLAMVLLGALAAALSRRGAAQNPASLTPR